MTDNYFLSRGAHNTPDAGKCAMEWVAFVAGEPHTDRPVCVSPLLQSFAISLNDSWDDEQRQKLRPYLARCIATAGDDRDLERSWLATDWLIRVFTPRFLDLVPSLASHAIKLRALPPVLAPAALDEALIVLCEAQEASAAAWDAAREAARDAAGDAAREAARDAAWDAARDAAWDAARDDAGDAAWEVAWAVAGDAAWAVARDAAQDAAWNVPWAVALAATWDAPGDDAAWDVLKPAVVDLQASVLDLFDRMLPLEPTAMPALADEALMLCVIPTH